MTGRATVAAIALCVLLRGAAASDPAPLFEIGYFPPAIYRGDTAVFVLEAQKETEVHALLNGTALGRIVLGPGEEPWTFPIAEPGRLVFRSEHGERAFAVVAPESDTAVTEQDGYLHADGVPAILLPCQRHPPRHDRRWETWRLLTRRFRDPRPVVGHVRVALSDLAFPDAPASDESGTGSAGWVWTVAKTDASEMNAFAAQADRVPKSDATLLALSAADLDRGAEWERHRMKLEWCVQRLRFRGHHRLFVAAPVLTPEQRRRYADWSSGLRTAAAGNQVVLLVLPFDKPFDSFEGWLAAARKAMARHVRFP